MSENQKIPRTVAEFYDGKNIFMTGAAGFLGSMMLEVLLRCAPGIKGIYILLRSKKELDPEARKDILFKKQIFTALLEENPKVVDKVHVISGDVSQPNLGIAEEQLVKLTKTVTIVFHAAASLSFSKALKFIAIQNCLGTKYIIEFCRKLQHIDAFIYTSTAYSNSNRKRVEEIIYRLPHDAQTYLDALEKDDNEFERLVSLCKPDWPNGYAFSKCLAENVVNDLAADLPVAVLRPSIIAPIWKRPCPGYIEEGFGVVELSVAVGKGFARVILAEPDSRFDVVSVDVVANAHVVAGYCIGAKRLRYPLIVNCTGHNFEVSFVEFKDALINVAYKNLVPNTYQEPQCLIVKNPYLYYVLVFYEHYLPAFVIDQYLAFKGKKLRLLPLYKFYEKVMKQLKFFTSESFIFDSENYFRLEAQLEPKDKEMFYMDMKDADMKEIASYLPLACDFYDWKNDKKAPQRRKEIVMMRTMFINFMKRSFLLLFILFIYFIIKQMFF